MYDTPEVFVILPSPVSFKITFNFFGGFSYGYDSSEEEDDVDTSGDYSPAAVHTAASATMRKFYHKFKYSKYKMNASDEEVYGKEPPTSNNDPNSNNSNSIKFNGACDTDNNDQTNATISIFAEMIEGEMAVEQVHQVLVAEMKEEDPCTDPLTSPLSSSHPNYFTLQLVGNETGANLNTGKIYPDMSAAAEKAREREKARWQEIKSDPIG